MGEGRIKNDAVHVDWFLADAQLCYFCVHVVAPFNYYACLSGRLCYLFHIVLFAGRLKLIELTIHWQISSTNIN